MKQAGERLSFFSKARQSDKKDKKKKTERRRNHDTVKKYRLIISHEVVTENHTGNDWADLWMLSNNNYARHDDPI